jgi:starvation-inducible DNA-binding protein
MTHAHVTDISINSRRVVIDLLNARLADAIDLMLAIKQAHWNIRGPSFIALHDLLDLMAVRMGEHADTMAERVVQLGGLASGTLQSVHEATSLTPYPRHVNEQADHLLALQQRLAQFGQSARAAIDAASQAGDADSADIMTAVSRAVDKDLWFIGAHIA